MNPKCVLIAGVALLFASTSTSCSLIPDVDIVHSDAGFRYVFVTDWPGNKELTGLSLGGYFSDHVLLTCNSSQDDDPAVSTDGKHVAFASDRSGDWEIYLLGEWTDCPFEAKDSQTQRLAEHPGADRRPAWSPDGKYIAFDSDRTGTSQIFVMDRDGANLRQLTSGDGGNWSPTWSPDGTMIAYHSRRDGNAELYVSPPEGGGERRITGDPAEDESPAWSPAGDMIAFVSNRDGNREIYTVNVSSHGISRVTDRFGDDLRPAWCWTVIGRDELCFASLSEGTSDLFVVTTSGHVREFAGYSGSNETSVTFARQPSVDR